MHGGEIAYLHHEGLTDMKPILNRGIGKRLRCGALQGYEMSKIGMRHGEQLGVVPRRAKLNRYE